MDSYILQPDKIVSYTQIKDIDTLIQFYTNCYNYLPELFIGAGIFATVIGLYVAFNLKKIKYNIHILIITGKIYLYNKGSFK
jgi:hypothetical protein